MRAVKLYAVPEEGPKALAQWKAWGIDTVMVGTGCLADRAFLDGLRAAGLGWSIIEPVFLLGEGQGAGRLALDAAGRPAVDSWVRFACPTNRDHRTELLDRLAAHAALGPDGISLDFIRFFQFWEMLPPGAPAGSLVRTCFCPDCAGSLAAFLGLSLPKALEAFRSGSREDFAAEASDWILGLDPEQVGDWRAWVITELVRRCVQVIRAAGPRIRIGLHTVPWSADDFGGARRSVLGQDLEALGTLVDFFTPMAYHHMAGRPAGWIAGIVADQSRAAGGRVPVVPCVQVKPYYTDRPLDAGDFGRAVAAALAPPSGGLAVFHHEDLAAEPEKAAFLSGRQGEP